MARYSSFLGRRVEVQYRASDTLLPASGTFVADSGRSIFLEQSFEQRGQHRHFRWEIPYQYLVKIALIKLDDSSTAPVTAASRRADLGPQAAEPSPETPASAVETPEKLASSAAAGAGRSTVVLPFSKRAQNA
ncbi:MAG TPA: hypothetical protein VKF79_09640 [Candidatus Acidoferrum sp.]|nr:hypothetical protein [Candidatus Acidoferrum sp.]